MKGRGWYGADTGKCVSADADADDTDHNANPNANPKLDPEARL